MSNSEKKPDRTFEINYVKNNNFHTVLATGVVGGLTNNGLIDVNFFTDRTAIPKKITYKIEEDKLGDEIERKTKSGVIREVHFGIVVDINTAKSIVEWLNEKINAFENQVIDK